MKLETIGVGGFYVVNGEVDTYVYRVRSIDGCSIELEYLSGKKVVGAGNVDYTQLRVPSRAQLLYNMEQRFIAGL